MNLGQMHSRVSGAIRRGTSLDSVIPFWVSQAARVLEQNYTFSWMRRSANATILSGNVPLSYALSPLIKSIFWIKPMLDEQSDGTVWYGDKLIGVEEEEVTGITGGNPQGYWLDGQDGSYALNFDAIPHQDYKFRTRMAVYTDWPVDDAATPTLLLRAELCLFAQTLILFGMEQRDDKMIAMYQAVLQQALQVLLNSEEELKMQHQNDLKMQYSGLE